MNRIYKRRCSGCEAPIKLTQSAIGQKVACKHCTGVVHLDKTSLRCPDCDNRMFSLRDLTLKANFVYCPKCDVESKVYLTKVSVLNPNARDEARRAVSDRMQKEVNFLRSQSKQTKATTNRYRPAPSRPARPSTGSYSTQRRCKRCGSRLRTRVQYCYRCEPKGR